MSHLADGIDSLPLFLGLLSLCDRVQREPRPPLLPGLFRQHLRAVLALREGIHRGQAG